MNMKQYLSDTFRYNDKVNKQVLKLIGKLSQQQEATRLFGHLISCQNKWMARLRDDPAEPQMSWWTPAYGLGELENEWDSSLKHWLEYIEKRTETELSGEIKLRGVDGNWYLTTAYDIAIQLNYHSIHHRAQIQSIIREQGLEPEFVDYIGLKFRMSITRIVFIAFSVVMTSGLLISCGDDADGPQFGPGQTPMQEFVLFLTEGDNALLSPFTFGSMLEFQKAGRISELCMIAKDNGVFQLTLWDLEDTTIITSTDVNAETRVLQCVDISDVLVADGDRVAVTITGTSSLFWNNNGSVIYPSSIGDVTILGFSLEDTSDGVEFPNGSRNDIYMGLSDIVFEPIED